MYIQNLKVYTYVGLSFFDAAIVQLIGKIVHVVVCRMDSNIGYSLSNSEITGKTIKRNVWI